MGWTDALMVAVEVAHDLWSAVVLVIGIAVTAYAFMAVAT